ncbi:hypothetical protein AAHC03_05110 [Spirometra sp. Aus1]
MGDTRGYAHSTRLDPDHRIFGLSDYNLAASSAVEGLPDEQKSSPVRRTFLLMITFEFILTVVLWLIYLRTRGPIITSMTNEVKFYNFTSSLFDVQVLAASRFTALEICYGCILTSSRWPSIVFTTVSTVAVIIKCVMFDFGIASDSPLGLAYTILVYNIVMPWLVTVFFEYRVLPQERMAEQISKNIGRLNANVPNDLESVTYPSIHHWAATVAASTYAASIYASPRGSIIDDEEPLLQTRKPTDYGSTEAPFDVAALLIQASKVRNDAWSAYESAVWGSCPNPSLSSLPDFTPQTSSACLPGFKVKLFRVEGLIPAPSRMIFNDLVHGVEFSPHWNPTVASARLVASSTTFVVARVRLRRKRFLGSESTQATNLQDYNLCQEVGESVGGNHPCLTDRGSGKDC